MSGDYFVSTVAVPVMCRAKLEEREVKNSQMEVLEVFNSYLAIPVSTFAVCRIEQVGSFAGIIFLNYHVLRLTLIQMKNVLHPPKQNLLSRLDRRRRPSTSVQMGQMLKTTCNPAV